MMVSLSLALLVLTSFLFTMTPTSAQWNLVWSDEFDGSAGDAPDPNNWVYDVGGHGWGNAELQYHTDDRRQNCRVEGGNLIIEAHKENYAGKEYTSARINTKGKQNWTYGKFEARIKIPLVQGAWPAFWMLGSNFQDVGWPDCGECDILEWAGWLGTRTSAAAHGPRYSGGNAVTGKWPGPISNGFHIYSIEWKENEIKYFVDGSHFFTVTPNDTPGAWVFDHDFFIILNMAIGGYFGGEVGENVQFPIRMEVDYVRVYTAVVPSPTPAPVNNNELQVDSIAMSVIQRRRGRWKASALVTVVNGNGDPVEGATVIGSWSGLVDRGRTAEATDSNGQATLKSRKTRSSGAITFCVTDLQLAGYVDYNGPAVCASISK